MSTNGRYVVVHTSVEEFLDEKEQQALESGEEGRGLEPATTVLLSTGATEPLEMEPLYNKSLVLASAEKDWQQKLSHYARRYPRGALLLALASLFLCYDVYVRTRPPPRRHQLVTDYTIMDGMSLQHASYDYKCLFGDKDDFCDCEDIREGPASRQTEHEGWGQVHQENMKRIAYNDNSNEAFYGIVFYGDDLVENLNGNSYGQPIPQSQSINQYYRNTFTYENEESSINSIAMGISGDSTSNLLWRLQNGEMPVPNEKMGEKGLNPNVFWLMIGSSDLARGGCSESSTLVGILKVAQTIHQAFPQSVVVIQGILPRSFDKDGLLEPRDLPKPLFGKRHSKKYHAEMALHYFGLWPSIQAINKQLADFCLYHEYFIYFDAAALFLEEVNHPKFGRTHKIIRKLMPDFAHPSAEGWKLLGNAISKEYLRIVLDEDQENDIETKKGDD